MAGARTPRACRMVRTTSGWSSRRIPSASRGVEVPAGARRLQSSTAVRRASSQQPLARRPHRTGPYADPRCSRSAYCADRAGSTAPANRLAPGNWPSPARRVRGAVAVTGMAKPGPGRGVADHPLSGPGRHRAQPERTRRTFRHLCEPTRRGAALFALPFLMYLRTFVTSSPHREADPFRATPRRSYGTTEHRGSKAEFTMGKVIHLVGTRTRVTLFAATASPPHGVGRCSESREYADGILFAQNVSVKQGVAYTQDHQSPADPLTGVRARAWPRLHHSCTAQGTSGCGGRSAHGGRGSIPGCRRGGRRRAARGHLDRPQVLERRDLRAM